MFDWNSHQVCLAHGPDDAGVLLAIRPDTRDSGDGDVVVWNDGTHQRAFILRDVIEDTADRFEFRDDMGRVFSLQPMTAKSYAAEARANVVGPELETDDDVRRFYLQPRAW